MARQRVARAVSPAHLPGGVARHSLQALSRGAGVGPPTPDGNTPPTPPAAPNPPTKQRPRVAANPPTPRACRNRRCPLNVCAVRRRRFPVGASPTRQPLQPEATGGTVKANRHKCDWGSLSLGLAQDARQGTRSPARLLLSPPPCATTRAASRPLGAGNGPQLRSPTSLGGRDERSGVT